MEDRAVIILVMAFVLWSKSCACLPFEANSVSWVQMGAGSRNTVSVFSAQQLQRRRFFDETPSFTQLLHSTNMRWLLMAMPNFSLGLSCTGKRAASLKRASSLRRWSKERIKGNVLWQPRNSGTAQHATGFSAVIASEKWCVCKPKPMQ